MMHKRAEYVQYFINESVNFVEYSNYYHILKMFKNSLKALKVKTTATYIFNILNVK